MQKFSSSPLQPFFHQWLYRPDILKINGSWKYNATSEELEGILGKRRAKKGMFEGDLIEGELEIGQVSGTIHEVLPVSKIVENLVKEFDEVHSQIKGL